MSISKKQGFQPTILQTIRFIQRKQQEMEVLRQELNHQIMFNLQDTYLNLASGQTSLNIKQIATFLNINEKTQSLQKMVKWNSHKNSLNLSFTQFSALLISKEDKLLAKMVLERQEMGAIPNFLLEITRKIIFVQLTIHQYCMNNRFAYKQFIEWINQIIDENGDIDKILLTYFIRSKKQQESLQQDSQMEQSVFLRYLQTTGNITVQRLKYLFFGDYNTSFEDRSAKFQRESTCITMPKSPKSMTNYKSMKQLSTTCVLRSEYFECLNRPMITEEKQLRRNKSIQKHRKRINFVDKDLRKNTQIQKSRMSIGIKFILTKIKQIISIEEQSQHFRTQLCLCADFYPVIFYETIPRDKPNFISASNFKDYLQDFGYKMQMNAIFLLYRRYCANLNRLDFNSFCSLFDVSEPEYYLLQKNRFIQTLNDIALQTKKLYFVVLNTLIVNECKINEIKNILPSEALDINETIKFLFSQYQQGINSIQMAHQFKKYLDYDLSRKQIKLLWKRYEKNLKNEEKIQKQDILNDVFPLKNTRSNKHFKL